MVLKSGNSPKGNLVVAKGEKISKLYWEKALVARDRVNAMDIEASLWHRRLSHMSEKGLNYLAKKDMPSRLKNTNLEKCSRCMVGKETKVSFKKHPSFKKSELLELMHSDVCGPLKVKSFSGIVMMTKALLRRKFETCCEIDGLAVTST